MRSGPPQKSGEGLTKGVAAAATCQLKLLGLFVQKVNLPGIYWNCTVQFKCVTFTIEKG